jgi:hypothetical protein
MSIEKEHAMVPFRASLPGRIVSSSVAFALLAGGLIALLGLDGAVWVPFALLIPVVGCFVGTVMAVISHVWAAMALVVALPMCLWPYTMLLMLATSRYHQLGWLLVAAGIGMAALTLVSGVIPIPGRAAAPARESIA